METTFIFNFEHFYRPMISSRIKFAEFASNHSANEMLADYGYQLVKDGQYLLAAYDRLRNGKYDDEVSRMLDERCFNEDAIKTYIREVEAYWKQL